MERVHETKGAVNKKLQCCGYGDKERGSFPPKDLSIPLFMCVLAEHEEGKEQRPKRTIKKKTDWMLRRHRRKKHPKHADCFKPMSLIT